MSYCTLVDTATLAAHIDDPDWVVIDCRFVLRDPAAGRRAYDAGHIAGAHYAHLNDDLAGPLTPQSGRHPLPAVADIAARCSAWGIDDRKQVVAYDDSSGAIAGRLWWLLRWLGHRAVAVLDGDLRAWQRERRALVTTPAVQRPARFTPRADTAAHVDAETVSKSVQAGQLLLDARAEKRFRGEIEPFDTVAGHVPGAVNSPFEDNLQPNGCFLPAPELRAQYQALLGRREPAQVIHMCGSGVTACHNLLAMEHAGLAGARLYVGSWSQWITDPKRPIATGP